MNAKIKEKASIPVNLYNQFSSTLRENLAAKKIRIENNTRAAILLRLILNLKILLAIIICAAAVIDCVTKLAIAEPKA